MDHNLLIPWIAFFGAIAFMAIMGFRAKREYEREKASQRSGKAGRQ